MRHNLARCHKRTYGNSDSAGLRVIFSARVVGAAPARKLRAACVSASACGCGRLVESAACAWFSRHGLMRGFLACFLDSITDQNGGIR
jgi:hypothetical protein